MKFSLIAIGLCCVVSGSALALEGHPGAQPERFAATDLVGVNPPKYGAMDLVGVHPRQPR